MHMQLVKERNFRSVFLTTRLGSAKHVVLSRRGHTDLRPERNAPMQELVLPQVNAFISYAHEDGEHAGQAKRVLAEVGINAFL